MENQEKIYSESELLQILYGLAHLYHIQPWYKKFYWRPFYLALEMFAIIIAGDSLILSVDKKDAVKFVQEYLDGDG